MIQKKTDPDRDLTIHTCSGMVTAEEIASAIKEFYTGSPTANNLWDLEWADLSTLTSENVMDIANLVKQHRPVGLSGKTALVTSRDLGFGLSRMFGTYTELAEHQVDMRSFRSMDEALAWMDLQ